MQSLQNKTALITGASSGIGAEFAKVLAKQGCHLVLVARREDRLAALKAELQNECKIKVELVIQDLSIVNSAQKLFDTLAERKITIDVLINNAGFGIKGDFLAADYSRIAEMMRLNMSTLTQLTYLFAKQMQIQGNGYILQVSSIGAFQPSPYYAVYSATKAYVLSFSEALNFELRGSGVSVTTLYPGMTSTEFLDVANHKPNALMQKMAMTANHVARIGIKAMLKRKNSIVSGLPNRLNVFFVKLMPRCWATYLAGHLVKE